MPVSKKNLTTILKEELIKKTTKSRAAIFSSSKSETERERNDTLFYVLKMHRQFIVIDCSVDIIDEHFFFILKLFSILLDLN